MTEQLQRARLSPAQDRTIKAIQLHGRLDHVRAGWAIPGSFEIVATPRTADALVAAGFCQIRNYTALVLPPARAERGRFARCR